MDITHVSTTELPSVVVGSGSSAGGRWGGGATGCVRKSVTSATARIATRKREKGDGKRACKKKRIGLIGAD
ncbi:hypothetical protein FF1_031303 [Malus domestica]